MIQLPGKYLRISLILSFVISLIIHFSLIASIFIDNGFRRHSHEVQFPPVFIIAQFIATFLLGFLVFVVNHRFYQPLSVQHKLKINRVISSIFITLVLVFIGILLLNLLNNYIVSEYDLRSRHREIEAITRNLFCAAIVLICINVIRFLHHKQTMELEVEQLKTQSVQSQFESLKNQMSPHFLFNSLTALNNLVEESPKTASTYINRLSQVLRYSLQSNKKQTVTVSEELDFIDSYLFLLKIRYGDNLSIKTNIDNRFYYYNLPPLTIQILIENAVKHNEISKSNPLLIEVLSTDDEKIVVVNKIQEKLTTEEGNGIGLSNLTKLFRLLGKEITIMDDKGEFRVEIPLLKPNNYEGIDN
ncbi:histidine kinase [Draconibacterium sp. IB214405]|uniref:sensor histidine kinase n=1 Tax=Draconibacterium sp. IB214405 TaxID=3097352 RepID=UPI002A139225|nr:histidine kinase [Draconibacterium sp. IB214405]MDX8339355.1 histidine kinase [Draconibacterium sp. IB214405]